MKCHQKISSRITHTSSQKNCTYKDSAWSFLLSKVEWVNFSDEKHACQWVEHSHVWAWHTRVPCPEGRRVELETSTGSLASTRIVRYEEVFGAVLYFVVGNHLIGRPDDGNSILYNYCHFGPAQKVGCNVTGNFTSSDRSYIVCFPAYQNPVGPRTLSDAPWKSASSWYNRSSFPGPVS